MATSIEEWINVRARASELGLSEPSDLAILPRGFETATSLTEVTHESDASTLRKMLAEAGLEARQLEPQDSRLPTHVQKSADWIAPTLFVGYMLLSQNTHAVQVALGVIQTYITDFLRDRLPGSGVELSIVVESSKSKRCKKLSYKGPVSRIQDIAPLIREMQDD